MGRHEVLTAQWSPDAVSVLTPAFEADPWGGLASPVQLLQGSTLLEAVDHGRTVALMAVKTADWANGRELCVLAAARCERGVNAIATFTPGLTDIAAANKATVITSVTGKRAVAEAMRRAGWVQSGVVMIKRLGVQ